MKKVLVTGVTGHLGFVLAKHLLANGYEVRAGVRDVQRARGVRAIAELNVPLVHVDLMDQDSIERALAEVDGFFQIAAVFKLNSRDPQAEVVTPNLRGTRNALHASAAAGIRRMVYTSSIAAVGTCDATQPSLDERHWNEQAVEPYAISKTRSEKEAWHLAEQLGVDLVTVLPGTIIGNDFHQPTDSLKLLVDLLAGQVPFAFPMSFSYVDARDVAEAHRLVYENPTAKGRYIATSDTLSVSQVCGQVKALRPDVKTSEKVMPAWLVRMLPMVDAMKHKLTGSPRTLSREVVQDYLGKQQRYGSTRLADEFGWSSRRFADSIEETLAWIESLKAQEVAWQSRSKNNARGGPKRRLNASNPS